ncbi:MAG: ribosome maturation factor RimP [Candidatus Omnitrophica bacterium]|nr:ribosome maturation factor RimP [Candidatus Omnitrophota bacterium]
MLSKDTLSLIEEKTRQLIEPLAFDLVELKYMQASGSITLRFLIDRVEGGINLDECCDLSKKISQFLEDDNIISSRYTLEVSSPGIDRPLREPKDFRRATDKEIHIFLKNEHKGKVEMEGKLIESNNEGITIVCKDGGQEYIPFLEIDRAKQVML